MAQVASAARTAPSLQTLIREGWNRLVRSTNKQMSKGIYSEELTFSDSLERELSASELHPYSY